MSKTKIREVTYRLLFSNTFDNLDALDSETLSAVLNEIKINEEEFQEVKNQIMDIKNKQNEIFDIIERNLAGYSRERVYKTDLAALILAAYEMKFTDVPKKVAINEALNLVKVYSDEKSPSFVNGVLAKIYKELENE